MSKPANQYSPQETDLIHEAIVYATRCHKGQCRKGTSIPYICHPISVMRRLAAYNLAPEILAAGVLHDVVEDTTGTMEEIQSLFGPQIATLVLHASEQERIADPGVTISWRDRKQGTIDHILHEKEVLHLWVTLADKTDNIQAIQADFARHGQDLWQRFNAGFEDQQWYFTSLANAFKKRAAHEGGHFQDMVDEFAGYVATVFEISSGL